MNIFEWEEDIPVTANNLNEMQNILNNNVTNGFQKNGTILWTNSSPSSSFSSQNITLSSNDYDMLLFIYKGYHNGNIQYSTQIIKGASTRLIFMGETGVFYRNCTYVDDTTYSIANESTSTNSRCIPLYIIGYKTGLFS